MLCRAELGVRIDGEPVDDCCAFDAGGRVCLVGRIREGARGGEFLHRAGACTRRLREPPGMCLSVRNSASVCRTKQDDSKRHPATSARRRCVGRHVRRWPGPAGLALHFYAGDAVAEFEWATPSGKPARPTSSALRCAFSSRTSTCSCAPIRYGCGRCFGCRAGMNPRICLRERRLRLLVTNPAPTGRDRLACVVDTSAAARREYRMRGASCAAYRMALPLAGSAVVMHALSIRRGPDNRAGMVRQCPT